MSSEAEAAGDGAPGRPASLPDLQSHLQTLRERGLLITIDEPVDKDTELHPLVRWQFRGGIAEADRKAFLFTHVVDGSGYRYPMPVLVGALAASAEIYRIGMGARHIDEIGADWARAAAHPLPAVEVASAPCQARVTEGAALLAPRAALDGLPIPISTPGFDVAPYLTAANVITADPETGIQNMGMYRCCLKSPTTLGIMMLSSTRSGGNTHWKKYRARGQKMPCAIVLGCPPAIAYCGPQKFAEDVDELAVAGALADAPVPVVRCRSIDLRVPAASEIVIEGLVDTDFLEPEGPFGESHGYVALEDFNMLFTVTAITQRVAPVLLSVISQVTPSESSVIKRVAYEPQFLSFLRDTLGIRGAVRVCMHEPLTNLRRVMAIQFARGTPRTEIWRALYGTTTLQASCGKYVIAVDEDIDPRNADALFWALSYRANPAMDMQIIGPRERGHGPRSDRRSSTDAALLVDATMKQDLPPLALPKREFMERSRALWERLGLPRLVPESPWYGYSMGDWTDAWDAAAERAAAGKWFDNGQLSAARRRTDVEPNAPVRDAPPQRGGV
jgi:4-hydroxy-3-polyprenylbenzoate decarboxylase